MFVQPIFLAGLAALGIPLIVHLIFRRKTKEVSLGTLRFLKIVLQENARRKRVMRWLLLALRLCCVALLALAFARPFVFSMGSGKKDDTVAILIDRSASMMLKNEGRRLIDQAIAEAKAIVAKRGEGAHVEVAFFDQKVWPIKLEELDRQSLDTTYGPTNYGIALAWAHDVLGKHGVGEKQLHLFSDLQRSGLDWSDVELLPGDIAVELHDLGRELPNNIALTAIELSQSVLRPGDTTTVSASVFNAGPLALEELPVEMTLQCEGKSLPVDRQKIRLEPGAVETVEFQVPELETGLYQGSVTVETRDDLPFDNQRYLAIQVADPYTVLILDGEPRDTAVMSESYYLTTALRLAPPEQTFASSPYAPTVLKFGSRTRLPDLSGYDVIVLANVLSLGQADAALLADFVQSGGGLVVFTGENVQADGYASLTAAGLGPGEILGEEVTYDLPWRLKKWDVNHSIFKPFADPQHGDLRRLAFRGYTQIDPREGAHVIATFDGGAPCMIELPHGDGQVIWFASACDRQWSDWSRGRLFVPLVHQMFGYLTGITEGGPVREQLLDGDQDGDQKQTPGVYKRNKYWQVLNVVPRESEMDRCTPDDFVNRFGITLSGEAAEHRPTKAAQVAPELADSIRDNELWHWLLIGLMGVLVAEFFVANRTTV